MCDGRLVMNSRVLLVLVLAFFFYPQNVWAMPHGAPASIAVGAILPLSGPIGSMGVAAQNGIEMALSRLPPEQRARIHMVYEDDAFVPKNTVSAFTKLVSIDKVSVVIAWGSATSNAIAKLAEAKGIVFLSISSDPGVSSGKSHVFSLWVTPDAETAALLPEAERRGYKRLVRVSAIHDGTLAVKKSFDQLSANRFDLIFDEDVTGDNLDFRSMLAKLKGKEFDAFLPILFPEPAAAFARQARELGFQQPFFGYEMFEDPQAVVLSNGALLDTWYASYDDPAEWFLQEYSRRYPGASLVSAANGHDCVMLINSALDSGNRSSAEISEFFRTLHDFTGAMGSYSAVGENKFSLPAALKRVTKEGFPKL